MIETPVEEIQYGKQCELIDRRGRKVNRFYELKHCQCGKQIVPRIIEHGGNKNLWENNADHAKRKSCSPNCASNRRTLPRKKKHKPGMIGENVLVDISRSEAAVERFLYRGAA
jgi:hypothetical protein